jgi:hypothetical protein
VWAATIHAAAAGPEREAHAAIAAASPALHASLHKGLGIWKFGRRKGWLSPETIRSPAGNAPECLRTSVMRAFSSSDRGSQTCLATITSAMSSPPINALCAIRLPYPTGGRTLPSICAAAYRESSRRSEFSEERVSRLAALHSATFAKFKTFSNFASPRCINGLRFAEDMIETPPPRICPRQYLRADARRATRAVVQRTMCQDLPREGKRRAAQPAGVAETSDGTRPGDLVTVNADRPQGSGDNTMNRGITAQ